MTKSRIDLRYGGGEIDILLDLRSSSLVAYHGDEVRYREGEIPPPSFHARYGGKQYYSSRSGASGAGWVPARPWLATVTGYRTDVRSPWLPLLSQWDEKIAKVFGTQVCVPFYYRGSGLAGDWPAVVRGQDGQLALLPIEAVADYVGNRISEEYFSLKTWEIGFIRSPLTELAVEPVPIRVHRDCPPEHIGRVVEALVLDEVCFQWPEPRPVTINFWTRLGLHRVGEHFYKISRGVARKRYNPAELESAETLQQAVPANVAVLAPDLYIQGEGESWTGVGRFTIDGEGTDFEVYLESPTEAARAMAGDESVTAALRERLIAGAREKIAREAEARRLQEAWAAEQAVREGKFRALCEQHADLDVTLEDSIAAGNCRPGTEGFRDREFPGKNSVTVGKLVRFLSVYGVRRVLEHKLLPLARRENEETPNS
ncbi:hypothetical protein HYW59_00075 [Candidatus Kaiserbacteria bacterium]|nr:hypothetical protein [Candidatus Kaiserbacteria bacterium]